jgi:AAA+ ATPase superfamily predicted ATPase
MPDLIDRSVPLATLRDLLDRPGPSVALVYGRRRVGKTYLLSHTWPAERTFYFVAADTTAAINRAELLDAVGRHFGLTLDPVEYPTWRTIFRLLLGVHAPQPLAIVLDEFQYLADADPSIASQLAAVLDVHHDRRPFVLALSGSVVSTMAQLATGSAPLYGRLAATIALEPFDYWDAAAMMPFAAARDRAVAYGIYGGTPRYLASIRADRALADNVANDVLAPGGQVRTQVESVIEQERGLRNTDAYNAILRAVGAGRTLPNDIAQFAGLPAGTSLRAMLETLVRLGYIAPHRNLDAKPNGPIRYALADPALRFQAAVVARYRSELATVAPRTIWDTYIKGAIDQYMGLAFERIAEQGYRRQHDRLGLPTVDAWTRWEGVDKTRTPREIDIVARLSDGRMMTGAVNWGPLDASVHIQHLRALRALADAGRDWAHEALAPDAPLFYVSGNAFASDFTQRARVDGQPVIALTLDDLYRGRRWPSAGRPTPRRSSTRRR